MKSVATLLFIVFGVLPSLALAQVGGSGLSRQQNTTTLHQTQPTRGLSQPWYCTNSAFSSTGQAQGYMVLYDVQGHPHTVPYC